MAENSFFITASSGNIYETKLPIDTDSATALCFEVTKEGKKYFLKSLRPDLLDRSEYRVLFKKEYETMDIFYKIHNYLQSGKDKGITSREKRWLRI